MRTLFIGGGQGCCEVLDLVSQGRLGFLGIEVVGVVDVDPNAPGLACAVDRGWPTLDRMEVGLALPDLELVIEITGSDEVLARVHRLVAPGTRVIDHVMARVFWDLDKVASDLRGELDARSELQAVLTRDRGQLQDTLDAVGDLIVEIDRDSCIVRVNQRFEQIVGRRRERILGKPLREVFVDEVDREWGEDFAELHERVMTHGRPAVIVCARRSRSGGEGHYQIKANPIFDEDLDIARVVVSAREITQQILLKRETEESARRFEQILDAVHGLITIKDLDGRYVMVNPWTEKVLGVTQEYMIGKSARDFFSPTVTDAIESLDRQALEARARQVDEEVIRIDGVKRIFVSERVPLTDYKGDLVALCTVRQDRTRRRQMQQEMIQNERLAAIGKLAAGVAHEINNPLSGILTFAQDLLLESDPEDPRRGDYDLIVHETLRCRRIVRDLLEFSRQREPRRRRVDLSELVARAVHMLERQVSFHNIEFDVSLPEDLPALHADPQQVQQVLVNLMINAGDAMDHAGTIRVQAAAAEGEHTVTLVVSDTGCGIAEDVLPHIFEPFRSSKGERGHGLGLPAVQGVVDRHGGTIEVQSAVGEGTTFRVTLPAAPEQSHEQ